jgi:hypothetical protein
MSLMKTCIGLILFVDITKLFNCVDYIAFIRGWIRKDIK